MAIRVTEPNGLPRLAFKVEPDGRRVTLRTVRAEGMPRGRDASVLFKAATHRPVFARATDPRVAVEAGAESLAVS